MKAEASPDAAEGESLTDFLARPEVTPEVYAAVRALHHSGRSLDEASQKLWNLVRGFHPTVHVGRLRDQVLGVREFPPDTWAEAKEALRELEAGLDEFGDHPVKRLILRPRRERLQAALGGRVPPALLAGRVEAALCSSG